MLFHLSFFSWCYFRMAYPAFHVLPIHSSRPAQIPQILSETIFVSLIRIKTSNAPPLQNCISVDYFWSVGRLLVQCQNWNASSLGQGYAFLLALSLSTLLIIYTWLNKQTNKKTKNRTS